MLAYHIELFSNEKDRYRQHQYLYRTFGSDIIWSICNNRIILRKNNPFEYIHSDIGIIKTRKFELDSELNFFAILNPVIKQNKKRIPIKSIPESNSWAIDQFIKNGIELTDITLNHQSCIFVNKPGEKIIYNANHFIGKLKVLNEDLFLNLYCNGIGQGKAFGLGMLYI